MDYMGQLSLGNKPSFFELVACTSLTSGIRPALRFLITVFAQRSPAYLGWALRHFDEFYLMANLLLQRRYLRNHSASFAENFYQLKRTVLAGAAAAADGEGEGGTPAGGTGPEATATDMLPGRQRAWSFFFLVLVPYIDGKLEKAQTAAERNSVTRAESTNLRRYVLAPARYLRAAWGCTEVVYQILYIFGRIEACSPALHWAGLTLGRLGKADYDAQRAVEAATAAGRLAQYDRAGWLRRILWKSWHTAIDAAKMAVPLSIFFLSFMQWWYEREDERATGPAALPLPPKPAASHPDGITLPRNTKHCPLCRKERTNPAALAASGYVFCYPCIFRHVERYQRCPVTHARASKDMLVRIHSD